MAWPKFTWDPKSDRYRDAKGLYVKRTAVRAALDEFVDAAAARISVNAELLQAGAINLPEWHLRMERDLKAIHVASAAIAAGGWAQATAKDWSVAANRLKAQYRHLARFAKQIENGLPLDGRFLARAANYAASGTGTYETVLRRIDLSTGLVIEERRLLHSMNPCGPCHGYHALGWQLPDVLPDIGDACDCHTACRCTFERRRAKSIGVVFTPSDRAEREGYRTVWVDVAKLDEGFRRDAGFYVGPNGAGAIPGRQAEFRRFLAGAKGPGGAAIEQPEITVDADGVVSFVNGRHRFSVLRDMGVAAIPVSVAPGDVATARRLFGAK